MALTREKGNGYNCQYPEAQHLCSATTSPFKLPSQDKTCSPAPLFRPIWSRCQSEPLLEPLTSVFCSIAARVLKISLTAEKTNKGKDCQSKE